MDNDQGQFKTHVYEDNKLFNNEKTDNSWSFSTKIDVHKSMSARSWYSSETQDRNPNPQMSFKNKNIKETKSKQN